NICGAHVLTIKVDEDFASIAREHLTTTIRPNILEYRLIVDRKKDNLYNTNNTFEEVDHIQQFKTYVLTNIGNSQLIQDELAALLN
ncbi:MAG: hypothetical protein J6R62_03920, partial [Rikenellaceae bacterium]|nr:hypothetical protein [Rikenellaceae bacterium]